MTPPRICPDRDLEFLLAALAVILVLLVAVAASSSQPVAAPSEVAKVEAAVLHVVKNGIPEHKIEPWPRHPLARNPIRRREFATAVVFAGGEHAVDHFLLTAIGFREGSFRMGGIGTRDEVSAFQIVPRTLSVARKWDDRCSDQSYRSAALCAAVLLSRWRAKCGSIEGAVSMYASGRTCRPDTARLAWIVRDRIGIARKLRNL